MSYGKYFYQNKNENDDIRIHSNKILKQEYKNYPLSSKIKSDAGIQTILNYQNKSSRNINTNDNIQNSNYYVTSSLKDQILSPGDDDISPNFSQNKTQTSKLSNFLDDDIIFNQFNKLILYIILIQFYTIVLRNYCYKCYNCKFFENTEFCAVQYR